MEAHYYNVDLKWISDRKGVISSPELINKIEVATPPEYPKGIEGIWSPEHLLTAAVNSCFMTTFLAIAENSGLHFLNFNCSAKGKVEKENEKYLMSEIVLNPVLVIMKLADKDRAERILQKTAAACLISNSVKTKVSLVTEIKT